MSTSTSLSFTKLSCSIHWELIDEIEWPCAVTEHGIPSYHESRRRRAQTALTAYRHTVGDDTPEELLVDLLTDLRHWCERRSLSFDDVVERSLSRINVETYRDTD